MTPLLAEHVEPPADGTFVDPNWEVTGYMFNTLGDFGSARC
ncbi:hypothetical protein FAIPA1_320039 [Frankia sp. AiPs1]